MAHKIEFNYLNRRSTFFRLDVFPFIILYVLTIISGIFSK